MSKHEIDTSVGFGVRLDILLQTQVNFKTELCSEVVSDLFAFEFMLTILLVIFVF